MEHKVTVKPRHGGRFEALAHFLEQLKSKCWLSKPSQRLGNPQIELNPAMEMRHGGHFELSGRWDGRCQSQLYPL